MHFSELILIYRYVFVNIHCRSSDFYISLFPLILSFKPQIVILISCIRKLQAFPYFKFGCRLFLSFWAVFWGFLWDIAIFSFNCLSEFSTELWIFGYPGIFGCPGIFTRAWIEIRFCQVLLGCSISLNRTRLYRECLFPWRLLDFRTHKWHDATENFESNFWVVPSILD